MLGEALEAEFGVDLTIGPAVEEGFYYDCFTDGRPFTDADKPRLEKRIQQVGCSAERPAGMLVLLLRPVLALRNLVVLFVRQHRVVRPEEQYSSCRRRCASNECPDSASQHMSKLSHSMTMDNGPQSCSW